MAVAAAFGIILYILSRCCVNGKFIEGHLKTKEDWTFLTRFCFLSERGRLKFEFEYPKEYEPQNILLYYDEPDQWAAVYHSDKNCTERESVLVVKNNQKLVLSPQGRYAMYCDYSGMVVNCSATQWFRSMRERWWFIAVSKCDSLMGVNLYYRMWLTNGDGFFFKHFSADEFYILQVDIAFLLINFLMLIASAVVAEKLKERQLFHSTYKLYIAALSLEMFHLFFMCLGYGIYGNNGIEHTLYGFKTFGRILESISFLVFLLMLILMAKGFTITRGRISSSGSIKISIFMTLYVICYAVLFIYEANFFDPGEVLYLYESPAGYGIIALRLLAWIWFLYAIFFTVKHFPEKSKFFFPFLAFYTIWFWAGPIVVLIAMKAIPLWVREKAVNGVELTVTFMGHLFFLILTRPTAANKNFPYHVRTCQIGILENTQNGMSMDSNGHGPYAINSEIVTNGGPDFTGLFTVPALRNTEQKDGPLDSYPRSEVKSNPFVVTK